MLDVHLSKQPLMHNIFPSPSSVSIADRHLLNGHSGGLLWFTDKLSLQQCVDEVIEFLLKQGLIMKNESSA